MPHFPFQLIPSILCNMKRLLPILMVFGVFLGSAGMLMGFKNKGDIGDC